MTWNPYTYNTIPVQNVKFDRSIHLRINFGTLLINKHNDSFKIVHGYITKVNTSSFILKTINTTYKYNSLNKPQKKLVRMA